MEFKERFRYGFCPETGKKAELMFIQHMLAVLRPKGILATVAPHGVLFRGGKEGQIRKGFIDDDLIEAVIGLGPNLFYGTQIPACILVMRQNSKAKPKEDHMHMHAHAHAWCQALKFESIFLIISDNFLSCVIPPFTAAGIVKSLVV